MYLYKKKGISLILSLSMLFTGCNIAYADEIGTNTEVVQNQDDSAVDETKQEEIEYQIEIEQKEITLKIGETQELKYKILADGKEIEIPEDEIKWISDDEEVALINKGVITAVMEGITQITAFLRKEPTAAPEYE